MTCSIASTPLASMEDADRSGRTSCKCHHIQHINADSDPSHEIFSQRERLSKAMGAAFLSHQVEQLERSVDSLAFSRDARLYNNTDRSNGRQHKHNSRTSRSSATSAQNPTQARPAGAKERRVIDASALVHALPVIKRWVRQDTYQLIVPLQGEPETERTAMHRRR